MKNFERLGIIQLLWVCFFLFVSTCNVCGANPFDDGVIVADQERETLASAAGNPDVSAETLLRLSNGSDLDVKAVAAENPKLTDLLTRASELDILSKSDHWKIRLAVAKHRNTSSDTLLRLSNDSDVDVKNAAKLSIVENTMLKLSGASDASEQLDSLSNSDDFRMRLAVANNKNTALNTLLKLGNDSDHDVRAAVIENPRLSSPLLGSSELDMLANSKYWKIRQLAAGNPNTSINTLFELSCDIDVRDAVIENTKLSSSTISASELEMLSASNYWKVRLAVAKHKNTSSDTLLWLSNDSDTDVKKAAKSSLAKKDK
ncbi:MAG: hypothetical protein HQM10_17085 [Candidatus Riflebacteria bacterium]|nr:hypothetical protein [Candidatus Riflebacteria bacterium]